LGIPPTPEEVAAFERDSRPDAWERVVDRMLASPLYGERWGRHWLDVMRFAQSNGYERDGEKANAWRYRDYVIRALNADKPYDQFIREHIAGDNWSPLHRRHHRHRIRPAGRDGRRTGRLPLTARYDELDDMVSTTGTAFLGLSIGCARCHDKFDPIPHEELTTACCPSSEAWARDSPHRNAPRLARGIGQLGSRTNRTHSHAGTGAEIGSAVGTFQNRGEAEARSRGGAAVREGTVDARDRRPARGNARAASRQCPQPGRCRSTRLPQRAAPRPAPVPQRPTNAPSSGRRTVLAAWIANRNNPLTRGA
jgi:hypothetical protein